MNPTEKKLDKVSLGNNIVSFLASINTTTLYGLMLKNSLLEFLLNTGKFFLFTAFIPLNIATTALAWRRAVLQKYKDNSLARALIETVTTITASTAIIGGFVATALFSVAGSIIFTVIPAFKSIFNFVLALKYLIQSCRDDISIEEKESNRKKAMGCGMDALLFAAIAIATGLVFVGGKTALAGLGVGVGVASTGIAAYALYKAHNNHVEEVNAQSSTPQDDDKPSSTAIIRKRIKIRKKIKVKIENHHTKHVHHHRHHHHELIPTCKDAKNDDFNQSRTHQTKKSAYIK